MTQQLDKSKFEELVEGGKGLKVVDMFATWCGPCKMLSPIVDELSEEYDAEKVEFFKVDIDQERDLANKYSVSSVPTLLVFRDGNLLDTLIGFMPKDNLKEKVDYYVQ